jgi:hypothetical protein
MNKKLAIRTLLLLVSIAAIVAAYQALTIWAKDWGGGKSDTVGVIAALEETKNGARVVAIETNGNKKELPGGNELTRDIDFGWGADGSHIYLSTNRDPLQKSKEGGSYNIFRWKFGSNEVEPLTDQRRTMSAPRFFTENGTSVGVVISGGRVMEFLPSSQKSTLSQIMPPINKDRSAGGEGEGAAESNIYARYGNSFRQAFYLPGHYSMLAVMSRDDAEVLVFHDFRPDENGRTRPPLGLIAGSRIQLDMTPDGHFVIAQQDATVPDRENVPKEWMKDGKLFPNLGGQPFHHMLWIGKLDATGNPIPVPVVPPTIKPEEEVVFMDPALSPDGNSVAVIVAQRPEPNTTVPQGLVVLSNLGGKDGAPKRLVQGPVLQPSWAPDGKSILFTMPDNGMRSIFEIQADGSNPRKVIGGGNFAYPRYSPQVKKAS